MTLGPFKSQFSPTRSGEKSTTKLIKTMSTDKSLVFPATVVSRRTTTLIFQLRQMNIQMLLVLSSTFDFHFLGTARTPAAPGWLVQSFENFCVVLFGVNNVLLLLLEACCRVYFAMTDALWIKFGLSMKSELETLNEIYNWSVDFFSRGEG